MIKKIFFPVLIFCSVQSVAAAWWWPFSFVKKTEKDAYAELVQAQLASPYDPLINYNLGVLAHKKGDTALAQASFERVIEAKELASADIYSRSAINSGHLFSKTATNVLEGLKWKEKLIPKDILQEQLASLDRGIDRYMLVDENFDKELNLSSLKQQLHDFKKIVIERQKELEKQKKEQDKQKDQKKDDKKKSENKDDQQQDQQDKNDSSNQGDDSCQNPSKDKSGSPGGQQKKNKDKNLDKPKDPQSDQDFQKDQPEDKAENNEQQGEDPQKDPSEQQDQNEQQKENEADADKNQQDEKNADQEDKQDTSAEQDTPQDDAGEQKENNEQASQDQKKSQESDIPEEAQEESLGAEEGLEQNKEEQKKKQAQQSEQQQKKNGAADQQEKSGIQEQGDQGKAPQASAGALDDKAQAEQGDEQFVTWHDDREGESSAEKMGRVMLQKLENHEASLQRQRLAQRARLSGQMNTPGQKNW